MKLLIAEATMNYNSTMAASCQSFIQYFLCATLRIISSRRSHLQIAPADLIDLCQLFPGELHIMYDFHILDNLLWSGRSDQHTGHILIFQDPAQCHLCKRLSSLICQFVQCSICASFSAVSASACRNLPSVAILLSDGIPCRYLSVRSPVPAD